MKQTAIEWLVEQLDGERHLTETEINRVIDKAKAMEKEQIMDVGKKFANYNGIDIEDIEQYYNETFKSE